MATMLASREKTFKGERMSKAGNFSSASSDFSESRKRFFLHEMRNATMAMLGSWISCKKILDLSEVKPPNGFMEKFQLISDEVDRMTRLLREFTDSEEMQRKRDFVSVADLLKLVIEMSENKSKEKNISFSMSGNDSVHVYANRDSLIQVFLNIVNNSIDSFCGKDNPTIYLDVCKKEEKESGRMFAEIEISDNGCGIDADSLKRVFEEGFSTKRSMGGSGIGLAVVKKIIECELNGYIQIESMRGIGTEVFIRLPLGKGLR